MISHGTALTRLRMIANTILAVEARAMCVDGPVTNTRIEMTDEELRRIYKWASSAMPSPRRKRSKRA